MLQSDSNYDNNRLIIAIAVLRTFRFYKITIMAKTAPLSLKSDYSLGPLLRKLFATLTKGSLSKDGHCV
jgi:hypothetical protein